jgi:hypothetical protein
MGKAAYRYWRSRAKVLLRVELREARYSKNRWNTVVLPLAEHLGYRPVIIVSYRQPAEVVLSDMRQLKNMPSTFMASITQTYLDALYALGRYGGVVVDHADLVDPAREDWAFALEAVTGLEAGHLLAARRRLLKPVRPRREDESTWLPSDLRTVAQCLASRRNLAVVPEDERGRSARWAIEAGPRPEVSLSPVTSSGSPGQTRGSAFLGSSSRSLAVGVVTTPRPCGSVKLFGGLKNSGSVPPWAAPVRSSSTG